MSERPEDRGLLAEAAGVIRAAVHNAVAMELISTDQGQYGFMVTDVVLADGGSLAERDPDLLDRLQSSTWDLLVGVGWWGAAGEDEQGFARVRFADLP